MRKWLPLISILVLALVLRIWAAFNSLGFDHPNENYRLLEPLADLSGWGTRLPWEWTDGLLSRLPVLVHRALLGAVGGLIPGPLGQLIFLRALYGALSLFQVLAAWKLVRRAGGSEGGALAAAFFMAVWPEFIFRSVRLMDYSLEASLLGLSIILLLDEAWSSLQIIAAGVVLAFAFFVRPQSGLAFVSLSIGLLMARQYRAILVFAASYAASIGLLAWQESHHSGLPFLAPFLNYVDFNLLQHGAAERYGSDPWHRYLSELAKIYGFAPLALLPWLLFRRRLSASLAILLLLPLAAHMAIAHKEGRFLLGFSWLLAPLLLAGATRFPLRRWDIAAIAAIFTLGFAINLERISRRFRAGEEDVRRWSELGEEVAKLGAKPTDGSLIIYADPDFAPGGFFLRYPAGLCYRVERAQQGDCRNIRHPIVSITSGTSGGGWKLNQESR